MMWRPLSTTGILCAILCGHSGRVWAQAETQGPETPIRQTFRLTIPADISLTCPDTDVDMEHSGQDQDQRFPRQVWSVRGNTPRGVTLSFTLDGPFRTGAGDQDHLRRDASARLILTRQFNDGPFRWTDRNGRLDTDIARGKFSDSWQTRSIGVGAALIHVDMTFINRLNGDGLDSYAGGEYITTLTGEVTESP
ncbi:MAG: hypothetical protein KDA80_24300 [Planctomycetaceae bacterium]|nr:hypothetical protein [Planctomycetaceae bacterium]